MGRLLSITWGRRWQFSLVINLLCDLLAFDKDRGARLNYGHA